MGLRHVLVHVDSTEACAGRAAAAARLAAQHEAHLTGLYVVDIPAIAKLGAMGLPPDMIDEMEADSRAAAEIAKAGFEAAAREVTASTEWRCVDGAASEVVALHARYADLTVIGQELREPGAIPGEGWAPESVVLAAGRPALIVPFIGTRPTLGESVLVAWNASREATRAVADALPILKRAGNVTVLAVNPEEGGRAHGAVPAADISAWLARHGVKAEAAMTGAHDIDAGNAILSRAADIGADLLVMGCYGHSRMRELVMGGVSRQVLSEMTVPVLMSH